MSILGSDTEIITLAVKEYCMRHGELNALILLSGLQDMVIDLMVKNEDMKEYE